MEPNVGTPDRIVRLVLALILAGIGYAQGQWWLYVVAGIVALTAALGWCGLYTLLGFSTCPVGTKGKR